YIRSRLHYPNIITAEEISKDPDRYLVVLNYWYFNTLIDLKPDGGTYVHSLSEPFNEEMEISFDRMMKWLEFFNLKYVHAHCSGHAYGEDILEIIEEINPEKVYPIHTEKPGKFRKVACKTVMVKEGVTYTV
ncbi:MAG TPA: MBL fold metallo-hydrolase, partial [Thermoplasmatales archaeon]|nr:MBL fold metallo-hydrolase [Thermoplasmatales archaeon]